jgi:hypothetical protein
LIISKTKKMKTGIEHIAEERQKQVTKNNWTAEHDRTHTKGELAKVAATLAANGTDLITVCPDDEWGTADDPWGLCSKHKDDRIKQLAIVGACAAAEIDRLNGIANEH